jgi:hypothetical protein
MAYADQREVPVLTIPTAGSQPTEIGEQRSADLEGLRARLREAYDHADELNRPSIQEPHRARILASDRHQLERAAANLDLDATWRPIAAWVLPRQARADALAGHYQRRYRSLAVAIHLLAALAVTAVAAQIVFAPKTTAWLGFEIALLVLLIVALWRGRRGGVHERWMGYRSLAEAFRSGLYLSLADATAALDNQLAARRRADEAWVERLFLEAWSRRPPVPLPDREAPQLRELLIGSWICGQIRFHENTVERLRRRRARYTAAVYTLAASTILVAALHIAHVPSDPGASRVLEFLAIMLPAFGAAVTGLREQGQHRLHERRSERAAQRLRRLVAESDSADAESVRRLATATQQVIVEESVNWSSVVEFQNLEMVV